MKSVLFGLVDLTAIVGVLDGLRVLSLALDQTPRAVPALEILCIFASVVWATVRIRYALDLERRRKAALKR